MTPSYAKLRNVADFSDGFVTTVDAAFWNIRHHGGAAHHVLTMLADTLCSRFGLSGEIHDNAVVLYNTLSRAKHPACIVLSIDAGQSSSPSADYIRRTGQALIQVFEGDADDREVADNCPVPTHRIETKGRVLLN